MDASKVLEKLINEIREHNVKVIQFFTNLDEAEKSLDKSLLDPLRGLAEKLVSEASKLQQKVKAAAEAGIKHQRLKLITLDMKKIEERIENVDYRIMEEIESREERFRRKRVA